MPSLRHLSSRRRPVTGACLTIAVAIGTVVNGPIAQAVSTAITVTSSAGTVAPGSTVDLTASAPIAQAGSTTQQITQTIDPATVQLTSVSDITYPKGWALSYCSGSATDCTVAANFSATTPASAAAWAAVKAVRATGSIDSQGENAGRQVAQASVSGGGVAQTPTTLPSSGLGLDGFKVFFDPGRTRVFNIYHHTSGAIMDCYVVLTGTRCAGFPFNYGGESAESALGVVVGSTAWIGGKGGVFCVDLAAVLANSANAAGGGSPSKCFSGGTSALVSLKASTWFQWFTGGTQLGQSAETRLYALDSTSTAAMVYCIDTATRAACGTPTINPNVVGAGNQNGNDGSNIFKSGDLLYVSITNGNVSPVTEQVTCVRISSGAKCPGWTSDDTYSSASGRKDGKFVPIPAADGSIRAVCYYRVDTTHKCWEADGTQRTAAYYNFPNFNTTNSGSTYSYGVPTQIGSRVYYGNARWQDPTPTYSKAEVICFDATAFSGLGGRCNDAATNLYSTTTKNYVNYTVTPDPTIPNCLWITQHANPVFKTVNILTGDLGCSAIAPQRATFSGATSVPRMGCSASTAIQEWASFTLDTPTSGFTSAKFTVQDSSGTSITGWTDVPLTAGVALDLSALPVATTGQTPNFLVDFIGISGALTATARIKVIGDAPQLCTHLTAQVSCPVALGPVDPTALVPGTAVVVGSGSSTTGGSTTTFTSDTRNVTVSAPTSAQCGSTLTGRAGDATLGTGGTAVPGVTVALLDSSGSPVLSGGGAVTATTNASGNYSFGYLTPGSYRVRFPSPVTATSSSATVASGAAGSSLTTVSAVSGTSTSAVDALVVGTNGVVNGLYVIAAAGTADTSSGKAGLAQSITPLTNDNASSGATYSGGSTALRLCGAGQSYPGCTATTLVTSGQGSYSVSGTTVTFTPCTGVNTPVMTPACTGAFTGTASPVTYQSTDSLGRTATSTITPTVVAAPTATNDTSTGALNTVQAISPLANDTAGTGTSLVTSSLKICTASTANASCTGTTLNVAGQGTYTVNGDGTVSFAPCQAAGTSGASCTGPFAGTATAIKYVVSDGLGQQASATITPSVTSPTLDVALADITSNVVGVAQTVNPLANDTAPSGVSLVASTVRLCSTSTTPAQSPPNCTATSIIVAGKGVYTVNTGTGVLTFTPCNSAAGSLTVSGTPYDAACTGTPFTGTPTAATYQVTDNLAATARTVSSTYTPTVVGAPTAAADSSTGAFGATQTITVLANDSAATGGTLTATSVRLCPTGTANASCTSSTLVSSGKGRFIANADGTVTFAPCTAVGVPDASCTAPFAGAVPDIKYVVTDSLSQTAASTISVTVSPPAADSGNADTSSGFAGVTQTVNPLGNDTSPSGVSLVPTSVRLCTGAQVAPGCTGTTLSNAQGTYTVNPTTGVISFAPCTAAGVPNGSCTGAFTGSATAVAYQVSDNLTTPRTVSSTYTPTVVAAPSATNDTSTGAYGAAQTISVLANDTSDASTALSPTTVRLCDPSDNLHKTPPACQATTLTTIDGTYAVNANGTVTFTPVAGWSGAARAPPTYQVSDALGQTASATITPTVNAPTPPTASSATATVKSAGTVAFTPILGTSGLATAGQGALTTAYLCDTGQSPPNCTARTVTTADGTWVIDPATGVASYTNTDGTAGAKAPVTYQVNDANSAQASSTLTPTVTPAPQGRNDTSYGEAGQTQVIAPLGNDVTTSASFDPATLRLCGSGQAPDTCTATSVTTAHGTYTVVGGTVSFAPADPAWVGTDATVTYQATDTTGQVAHATITAVTLPKPAPILSPDTGAGAYGSLVTITPLANDTPGTTPADTTSGGITTSIRHLTMDASSLRLCAAGERPPSCTATSVTTVDGTYSLTGSTVTFTGAAGFTGTVTQPLEYQVGNSYDVVSIDNTAPTTSTTSTDPTGTCLGATVDGCAFTLLSPGLWSVSQGTVTTTARSQTSSSTITPTITVTPPTANPDTTTGLVNHTVTVSPLFNDTAGSFALNSASLRLCDIGQSPPTCSATSVTIAGQGTFSLDAGTGQVTFTPESGWTGTTTALRYVVADTHAAVANSTITVTVNAPVAGADANYGLAGSAQTISALANDHAATGTGTTLTAASVRLCDTGEVAPLCSKTTLTTVDGTYVVNGSGVVTFTPAGTFTSGAATAPVGYQVTDSSGDVASALITPHVVPPPTPAASSDTGYAPSGQPVVFSPWSNDSAGSTSSPTADITFANLSLPPTSIRLCTGGQAPPTCSATSVTTSEGTYTVNGDGTVTFAPVSGFTGTAVFPVSYQISTTYDVTDHGTTTTGLHETTSAILTPVIVPPPTATGVDDTGSASYGQSITFTPWANDTAAATSTTGTVTYTSTGPQAGFTGPSVRLCDTGQSVPTCTATTLTTVDGAYVVNADGTVTFTPATGFSGTATVTPTYQVTSPYSVTNTSPSTSGSGSASASAKLIPTISPLVAHVASPDTVSGPQDQAVAIVVPTNDSAASVSASSTYPVDATSVHLCGPADTAPGCTVTAGGSVVKAGQGVFRITNAATGEVTFTPCSAAGVPDASCTASWTGTTDVDYSVTDTSGNPAWTTFTVTINPALPPTAVDDTRTTAFNTAVTVDVAANDSAGTSALVPTSVLLCGPADTAPACTQTSVTNGTGTFTVNADGTITYTPATGFTGPAAIVYSIADSAGARDDALLSITVSSAPPSGCGSCGSRDSSAPAADPAVDPSLTADIAPAEPAGASDTGPQLQPQQEALVVNPLAPARLDPLAQSRPTPGATFDASTIRIWDGIRWVTSYRQRGVGTWTVVDAHVEFMPAPNYTGTAVITVRAMDTAGGVATARLRVVVTPRKLTIASRPGSTGQVPTAIRAAVVTSPTAICPSPSAGGPAVAFITVGAVTVPVKAVTMSTAGVLEPPASSRVAAVSRQHADLDADHGTSVLVWHSRFGQGCPGSLNPLLRQPIGTTFSVRTGTGMTRTYRIDQTAMVPQGRYRSAWFAQDGPHRLSLFTCSGLTSGRFTSTAFIHAVEVANGDS